MKPALGSMSCPSRPKTLLTLASYCFVVRSPFLWSLDSVSISWRAALDFLVSRLDCDSVAPLQCFCFSAAAVLDAARASVAASRTPARTTPACSSWSFLHPSTSLVITSRTPVCGLATTLPQPPPEQQPPEPPDAPLCVIER